MPLRARCTVRINRGQSTIRSLFDQQGISIPGGHQAWTVAGIETLSQHAKPLAECELNELWKGELDLELKSLDELWQQLQTVDDQLEKIAKQNESVKLLQTIPGVGRRKAEVIVAALDDPNRFQTLDAGQAYCGVPWLRRRGRCSATTLGQLSCISAFSALRHHRLSRSTASTDRLLSVFGLTDNLQGRVQDLCDNS